MSRKVRTTVVKNRFTIHRVFSYARKKLWHAINAGRFGHVGRGAWIMDPFMVSGRSSIFLADGVQIWPQARLETIQTNEGQGTLEIGSRTVIHPYAHIAAAGHVKIGAKCLFASCVYISDHDHDWSDPVIGVIDTNSLICESVEIGDSVWLGERVVVLKGVRIGQGSVIGAGSVVNRSIPDYSVAVGTPARVIKRYDLSRRVWLDIKT